MEGIESSRHALRLRPDYAEAFNNICAANNALGRDADMTLTFKSSILRHRTT